MLRKGTDYCVDTIILFFLPYQHLFYCVSKKSKNNCNNYYSNTMGFNFINKKLITQFVNIACNLCAYCIV